MGNYILDAQLRETDYPSMDYGAYLWLFCSTWVGSMSGLASVVLTILSLTRPTQNQRTAFIVAGLLSFFAGNAYLWTAEHRARLEAQESRLPHFRLSIGGVAVGTLGSHIVITIFPVVFNTGAPSILSVDSLLVKLPGSPDTIAQMIGAPMQNVKLSSDDGTVPRILFPNEYFPRKTMLNPIVTGASATGWASFVVPGFQKLQLTGETTLALTCRDVNGAAVVASLQIKDIHQGAIFVPSERELKEFQWKMSSLKVQRP